MTERRIDIAFGIDAHFLPHLGAVIASVVRHARDAQLRFIVLHSGVGADRRGLVETVAPHARFHWVEVGESDTPAFTAGADYFTRAILFRLSLEHLAPADCARVLYLDTDIIVLGDVREVFDVDLEGAPLAAVRDENSDPAAFAARWGLPENDLGYFNSGLLLIDLEQVRAKKLFSEAAAFVAEHGEHLVYDDQDALNWVLWGAWKRLPDRWNVQRSSAVPCAEEIAAGLRPLDGMPRMVHFTGSNKPWKKDGYHPWSQLYWDNLARTPFLEEVTRTYNIGALDRFRILARWVRRRPRRRVAAAAS